ALLGGAGSVRGGRFHWGFKRLPPQNTNGRVCGKESVCVCWAGHWYIITTHPDTHSHTHTHTHTHTDTHPHSHTHTHTHTQGSRCVANMTRTHTHTHTHTRSEEHTSELQSHLYLVSRPVLEY